MDTSVTNQPLFDRAFERALETRHRFEEQDRGATRAAARILDAARSLAERDPETYVGLKPSARDPFLVETLERSGVALSKLDALDPIENGLIDSELDITGGAPHRKPVTRGQRKACRRQQSAGGLSGDQLDGFFDRLKKRAEQEHV